MPERLRSFRIRRLALLGVCFLALAFASGPPHDKASAATFPVLATIITQFTPDSLTIGVGDTVNFT